MHLNLRKLCSTLFESLDDSLDKIESLFRKFNAITREAHDDLEYIEDSEVPTKELKSMLKKYDEYVSALMDDEDDFDLDQMLTPEGKSLGYELEGTYDDIHKTRSAIKRELKKKTQGITRGQRKPRSKSVSMTVLEKIYRAAKSSYSSSYAMMIDDARAGAQSVAKRHGINVFYDSEWFQIMFSNIKAHRTWDKIDKFQKQEMLDSINEEVQKFGKVK